MVPVVLRSGPKVFNCVGVFFITDAIMLLPNQ